MELRRLVQPEWTAVGLAEPDAAGVIRYLSRLLLEAGKVRPGFAEAVLEREKMYPTGLPTEEIKVAIPHTDAEYVRESAVALATLDRPVPFRVMGSPDQQVEVRVVFLLAIREKEHQAGMLAELMGLVQNGGLLRRLVGAPDAAAVVDLLWAVKPASEK